MHTCVGIHTYIDVCIGYVYTYVWGWIIYGKLFIIYVYNSWIIYSRTARFLEPLQAPEFPQLLQLHSPLKGHCYPETSSEISKCPSLIQSYFRMRLPNGASPAMPGTNEDAQAKGCEDGVRTTDHVTKLINCMWWGKFP